MLHFVVVRHFRLAVHALLLFLVGMFIAWPVIRYKLRFIVRPAEAVLRFVTHLMGQSPGIPRMAAVIFGYNATAIFIYMASGFHPLLPKVFGVWTGLNIAVLMGMVQREGEIMDVFRRTPGQWTPPPRLTGLCGLLVLLLELPCFWFSIAMGISLGHAVQGGQGYLPALAMRAQAYVSVIAPVLLVSAVSEAVAIRGSSPPAAQEQTDREAPGSAGGSPQSSP
ncbi:MAG: stage II sporulation protein M [Candidatus Brocadiia bacterium]